MFCIFSVFVKASYGHVSYKTRLVLHKAKAAAYCFAKKVGIKMKKIMIVTAALALGLNAATLYECQEKEQKYLDSVSKFNTDDYDQKKVDIRSVKSNLDKLLRCENVIDVTIYKRHATKVNQLLARYER